MTEKIAEGCIVLIPDNNLVQELREEIQHYRQVVKGVREGMVGLL